MKKIWVLVFLTSLHVFGQKQKVIYIVAENSNEIYIEKKKDSTYICYRVLQDRAYDLINNRKSNEVVRTLSEEEYRQIKNQILDKKTIAKMTDEELENILSKNKIYVIDLTDKKRIKKISVKPNLVIVMPNE